MSLLVLQIVLEPIFVSCIIYLYLQSSRYRDTSHESRGSIKPVGQSVKENGSSFKGGRLIDLMGENPSREIIVHAIIYYIQSWGNPSPSVSPAFPAFLREPESTYVFSSPLPSTSFHQRILDGRTIGAEQQIRFLNDARFTSRSQILLLRLLIHIANYYYFASLLIVEKHEAQERLTHERRTRFRARLLI